MPFLSWLCVQANLWVLHRKTVELSEQRESFNGYIRTSMMYSMMHTLKSPAEKREKKKPDNEVECMCALCLSVSVPDRKRNVKVPAYLCCVYLGC